MTNYSLVLSTNFPSDSWSIENNDYSTLQWYGANPKPTQQELDALWPLTEETIAKNNCKRMATELLYATDWTTIPDVANTANNPYLMNQQDFIAYRNSVRQLAVNPVVNPVFPVKPAEQWSS